ncbi:hypothetical protein GOP47_0028563 [Adiantum capillus-veneris]|nr:hypothetical protein GOP47_0028563 [Adiantum capillus-veneris]
MVVVLQHEIASQIYVGPSRRAKRNLSRSIGMGCKSFVWQGSEHAIECEEKLIGMSNTILLADQWDETTRDKAASQLLGEQVALVHGEQRLTVCNG